MHSTPLRRWLTDNKITLSDFARSLDVSRARVFWWVDGVVAPRGIMLDHVMRLTGLTFRDLLPDVNIQKQRRDQLRRQRNQKALNDYRAMRQRVLAEVDAKPQKRRARARG